MLELAEMQRDQHIDKNEPPLCGSRSVDKVGPSQLPSEMGFEEVKDKEEAVLRWRWTLQKWGEPGRCRVES